MRAVLRGLATASPGTLAEVIARPEEALGPGGLEALYAEARATRRRFYGEDVYLRGLVECSSFCVQNCRYCGLRAGNAAARRTRLSHGEILAAARAGYAMGFRSFVLQGGEDPAYSDAFLCRVVAALREGWPDAALTLSFGERSRASYKALRRAGAERYLLRHETADAAHFARLHPPGQSLQSRCRCLDDLLSLGYQTGAGMMVGSPGQTPRHLAADLLLLQGLGVHMAGIGPFLPAAGTPFAGEAPGSAAQTVLLVALARLLCPKAMLPATTALATLAPGGRAAALNAGANVLMPNLTPPAAREAYTIYDHKAGVEAAEGLGALCREIEGLGLTPAFTRGDHADTAIK